MNNFLTYHEYLNESNSENIVNTILDALNDTIEDLLNRIEAREKQDFPELYRPWSKFIRTMTRLGLIYDMVNSVEKYTSPTDELISINSFRSAKGSLEISAKIKRGDKIYSFLTEVIYAGGHNIQRLHYRYITKTDLPKTGNSLVTKVYAEKIKRMNKAEKLNKDLQDTISKKEKYEELITKNKLLSDLEIEQIVRKENLDRGFNYLETKWEDIPDDSHLKDAKYGNPKTKEEWESEKAEIIKDYIERWKNINIKWKIEYIKEYEKQIKKLQMKLDQLAAENK